MGHQADDVRRRLRQLGEPPPAHAGVELEVNRDLVRDLAARDDELEPRVPCRGDLARIVRRAHDHDARVGQLAPQLEALVDGGDAECGRARFEGRAAYVDRAVAVAVRLHDGPELGAVEDVEKPPRVVANGAEVDRDLAPVHAAAA